jgi:translation initiation factor 4E binding protein 1
MSEPKTADYGNTGSRSIPTRRVLLNDPSQLPNDYSQTPGGTLFSTTPGGSRIIYDRNFLMQCRNSPLTKSPPSNLPNIPGVTSPARQADTIKENGDATAKIPDKENAEEPQFEMDI